MLERLDKSELDEDLLAKAKDVLRLIKSGQRRVVVSGPAGTGKTRLIKHILSKVDGRTHVVAYTGQAARMLQNRGIAATTIHQLIYLPDGMLRAKLRELKQRIEQAEAEGDDQSLRQLNKERDRLLEPSFVLNSESSLNGADLCILDEASMIGMKLGDDLESFEVPMLVVGDPYQLGPVRDKAYYDLSTPDVRLTKILRQEAGSKIIKLATEIRRGGLPGRYPAPRNYPDLVIRQDSKMNNDDRKAFIQAADRILCSTNETRWAVNRRMLTYLGTPKKRYPDGDWSEELICLRNDHDHGLLNGMPITIRGVEDAGDPLFFTAEVIGDDEVSRGRLKIYRGWFDHSFLRTKWKEAEKLVRRELDDAGERLVECDWGYCITTHKAQGSEWPKVLFLTEAYPDIAKERRRLHYTAVTRATERLVVIDGWNQGR